MNFTTQSEEHHDVSDIADALQDTGYVVVRGAIPAHELAKAHRWIAEATDRHSRVADALQPVFETDGAVRKIRRLTFHDPDFWRPWIRRNGIAGIASSLVGEQHRLILHAAFAKPARTGTPVVPHQDQALWDTPYPGAITAWVALEDATIKNGCLEMYPGSHKRGAIPHEVHRTGDFHEAIDIAAQGLCPKPIPMKAGDMILWHRYMAHSSGPNTSEENRMAMVLVFADAGDPDFRAHDSLVV